MLQGHQRFVEVGEADNFIGSMFARVSKLTFYANQVFELSEFRAAIAPHQNYGYAQA
jgi:hypothetical protein